MARTGACVQVGRTLKKKKKKKKRKKKAPPPALVAQKGTDQPNKNTQMGRPGKKGMNNSVGTHMTAQGWHCKDKGREVEKKGGSQGY